ncbi:DUF4333 domain-containing protein [Streptomyces sp. TR06-5]|uniref:DUF4333 domain-containing protein n=1 Tax=unclassified Streptomyces TaxID=2593676 RepID=UPI00399F7E7C
MHIRAFRAAAPLAVTAAAGLLLVGCSTTPKLPKDQLGDTVAQKLAASTGQPEPDVSCPEDLVGEVGTSTRCTLTAQDGSTLGVNVEVTSVEGTNIKFDIQADDKVSSN